MQHIPYICRDIYLPIGNWRDEVDNAHPVYTGPLWILAYPYYISFL